LPARLCHSGRATRIIAGFAMRPILIPALAVLAAAFAGPALAQSTQGRWECHGAASTTPGQPAAHGLLAIFGQSYSYASATYQDPMSGGGDVEQQESGIAFSDGPLADAGVEVGQIDTGAGTVAMDLLGAKGATVLTCLAM
jgi:hypothetical protein